MWTFPVGLHDAHSTITFQEIEGNMSGLIAKPDRFCGGIDLRFSDRIYNVVQLNRWGYKLGNNLPPSKAVPSHGLAGSSYIAGGPHFLDLWRWRPPGPHSPLFSDWGGGGPRFLFPTQRKFCFYVLFPGIPWHKCYFLSRRKI